MYSGATSVSSGSTLYLSGAGSLANSAVDDQGVLDISATTSGASVASLSGSASGVVHLGGQTLTLSAAHGTFSGSIDGGGGLSIAAGTQVLAGASSYSGATTIASGATLALAGSASLGATTVNDDGTLQISGTTSGVSIASLSGSAGSAVDLGGKTLTLSAASSAFSGSISGGGGLTLAAGRQVLAGDNAYSGATSIAGGATLELAGSASLASSAVLDQGMLDVSNTTSGAALGTLAGTGAVNLGDRSLTLLAAASSFGGALTGSGTLIVAHGAETLTASNTLTGATVIDPGAAVALSGSGSLTSSPVQVDGLLDLSAASTGVSLPSLSGSGEVALGANDLVLTRATGQFTGGIQGAGALRLLGGVEGLGGTQAYMGGTFVQQATLNLADGAQLGSRLQVDSAGRVLVPAAASVAADVSNSGTLSVGSAQSLGTLRVLGSYSQSASGTLVESVSPTAGSMLLVQGKQLNLGGRLQVQLLPGRFLRRTYVLVQAPSSTTLSGTFSALQVLGASANQYTYELRYVADPQVLLTVVQAAPFATGGSGSGQAQVGRVLDSVTATATGALYARLNALFDAPSLANAMDALDGQLYVQTPQWILQGTQHAWSRIFDRLDLGQQADAAPRQQAFVLMDGARGRLLGDARTDSVQQSASAMTLGRQLHVGAWELGGAAGTLTLGASRPRIGDGMTASLFRVGVFGARKLGSLRVGGVLGYTEGQVGYAMAQRQARVWTLQSRIGRDFVLPGGNVLTPLLSLDLQHLLLSGSTESDPLLGLGSSQKTENKAR
jgi:autotransporter-associated beta strand protein